MQPDSQTAATLDIAPAILDALRLNGRRVVSLQLDLVAGGAATVTVTELITIQQGLTIAELMKWRCRLVPLDDDTKTAPIKLADTLSALGVSVADTNPGREG